MLMVVIAVLSLILAFPEPPFAWVDQPAWIMLCVAVATLVPPSIAMVASARAVAALEGRPADPGLGQVRYARGMLAAQWALGVLHAGLVAGTGWLALCASAPWVPDWPVLPGVVAATPLLLSIVLTWTAMYPADRAIREIALGVYLFRGKPAQPVWGLGRFLAFNFRHQVLIILAPMLLILAARDLIEAREQAIRRAFGHDFAPDLLLGAAALGVALLAPVMLRHIWLTAPLPTGPLRDQLQMLCKRLRLRCREILVWKSGGMIINAAVMGVIAPLRYVMITDAMLEQLDDRKIEAVFGHEAGHVKRHHILYFLLFAFISGCLLTIVGQRLQALPPGGFEAAMFAVGALLLVKWGVLFGLVSRRFERQADLFGVRALTLAGLPCAAPCQVHGRRSAPEGSGAGGSDGSDAGDSVGSDSGSSGGSDAGGSGAGAAGGSGGGGPADLAAGGADRGRGFDPICATAAHLFSETLNDVAHLNNIPPEAWSWRHGSIASRSRALQFYAGDPRATARFESSVRRMKLLILLAAVVSAAWAIWDLRLWTLLDVLW